MSTFKGFGEQQNSDVKNLKQQVNKSIKKLKKLLRKPTIVAGLLDKNPNP